MKIGARRLIAFWVILLAPVATSAEDSSAERPLEGTGIWSKAEFSAPGDGMCMQVWSCGPSESILVKEDEGERLTFLSDRMTKGACRTTSDVACRSCEAAKPAEECTWKIEAPAE